MPSELVHALVLQLTPYADEGLLVHAFTREQGYLTIMAKGKRSRASGIRLRPYFYPFSLLRLSVSPSRRAGDIVGLRDVEPLERIPLITQDYPRSAIAMYLSSVLRPLLTDHFPNMEMWDFLYRQVLLLAHHDTPLSVFPHVVLLELTGVLGISPQGEWGRETPLFNLQDGRFVESYYLGREHVLNQEYSQVLSMLNRYGVQTGSADCPRSIRGPLLRHLARYLELHTGVRLASKALEVLEGLWV